MKNVNGDFAPPFSVDGIVVIVYFSAVSGRKSNKRASSRRLKTTVTIRDVAARAGVSTATVSRVLAGQNGVGKKVRERVTEAAQKLDYQPNRLARYLRVGLRKVIGVVIPDLQNPCYG